MLSDDPTILTALSVAGVPTMGMSDIPVGLHTYFVSSVNGSAGYPGTQLTEPKATLAQALARCVSGDVVVLLPGHVETVSTAGGININVAGVQIVGLGTGAKKPTFTFSATAATITMTAASVSMTGIRGAPSIDSVVSPFVVSAANVTLDLEWNDASAAVEAVRAVLTTAGANNFKLNLVYNGFTAGNAVVNAVRLVGGSNAEIAVDFYGVASTSIVEFHTTATINTQITGYFYNSGTTNLSKNVIDTVSGSTWFVSGYDGAAASSFSGGSGGAIAGDDISTVIANQAVPSADSTANALSRDVVGNKADAAVTTVAATVSLMAYLKGAINWLTVAAADAVANAAAKDVIGNKTDAAIYVPGSTNSLAAYAKGTANLQERVATKSAAIISDGLTLFTVAGGPILVEALISVCITANDGTASTLQYNATPTVGSATTISGASASLANALAGATVTLAGTALSTAALLSATGPNLIANPGTVVVPAGVITATVAVGSTTGTWAHFIRYKPLAVGVTVS